MKVLVVANTAWYLKNFRLNLMRHLQMQHHEVVAVAPQDTHTAAIMHAGVRFEPWPLSRQGSNPIEELVAVIRLIRLIAKERPDLILTYTPKATLYGGMASLLLGCTTIPNISGLGQGFARGKWFAALMRLLYRLALRKAAIVFFQNEEDRHMFITEGLVQDHRCKRLPGSGVDLSHFAYAAYSDRPAGEGRTYLFASRLREEKGLKDFVEAARRVKTSYPSCQFQVLGFLEPAGPGSISREEILHWEREGLIRYLGVTDDIKPYLTAADCIVLPSYYREGVPRILLEAAASGRCVITTTMPGCKDAVINGISGILCPPRDTDALASVMLQVANMSLSTLARMGRNGRKYMEEQFDEHRIIQAYEQAINALPPPGP